MNVHLIALPPYSPELNPIEQLWDQVAVAYAPRVYKTLEEIEDDISKALRPFWENSKRVLQLLGVENYLLSSATASLSGEYNKIKLQTALYAGLPIIPVNF